MRGGGSSGLRAGRAAGKTTLVTRLLPVLTGRGFTVSTVKHAHDGFEVDFPGKDSHRHRAAGAVESVVSSATRWAWSTNCAAGASRRSTSCSPA